MLESNKKLYYSIKEVSEMTELKPYVLRYWESEFPSLKPSKYVFSTRPDAIIALTGFGPLIVVFISTTAFTILAGNKYMEGTEFCLHERLKLELPSISLLFENLVLGELCNLSTS